MKMKKLGWKEVQKQAGRPKRKLFGPLLSVSINDGGRAGSAYREAQERAKMSVEGSGCVRYSGSGLALPCDDSEKKVGR